ncbi:hypothetical protein [Glycomyces dulcitolivorans]|uniref:hypothetical protein n=1 Tax=Glycomyces dulcitolivorans TaxID=2200759 RepID=UPI001300801A|nr:hypothetical protein [Glycomyces dulcitolivorans]
MINFLSGLDYGSVPAWLAVGTVGLAAATFVVTQRDRILKPPRAVTQESHTCPDKDCLDVDVHNDGEGQIEQVRIRLWSVTLRNRKIEILGRWGASVRIGPGETQRVRIIDRDASAIRAMTHEGQTGYYIEVVFRDINRRWWYLDKLGKPKRLRFEQRRRRRGTRRGEFPEMAVAHLAERGKWP